MRHTFPLPRPTALRRFCALGLFITAGIGFSATQARAAGETLTLAQNDPTAMTGRATNFTASGTLNPADTLFGFDIYIFLKDANVDPTCAADFDTESAAALHSGGNETWVSPATGFQVGTGPTFNQPFKITFTGHGNYLLCGYVNGDFSTFATGELRGVVVPAPVTPPPTPTPPAPTPPAPTPPAPTPPTPRPVPAMPRVVVAPWITLSRHVLTCHAGTWTNNPSSRSYGWYVIGRSKKLASSFKLKVQRSLRGRQVVCRVTAANAAGSRTASSRPIRAS